LNALTQEEYFISRIDSANPAWQIRKDNSIITLKIVNSDELMINVSKADETFVRLLLLDCLADFQDFVSSISSMQSTQMMGANLMINMFKNTSK
ncbi:MAG: cation:proton antiporter, partial [Spirochaetales bacterium]|nr:cation:proton antiporter [Spirochaetales bacterium]